MGKSGAGISDTWVSSTFQTLVAQVVQAQENGSVAIASLGNTRVFDVDSCFTSTDPSLASYTDQAGVYDEIGRGIVQRALLAQGNTTVLAYVSFIVECIILELTISAPRTPCVGTNQQHVNDLGRSYGPSTSGKSYTLLGPPSSSGSSMVAPTAMQSNSLGLVPRMCYAILGAIEGTLTSESCAII